ncbi:MAG: class II histone deacetylase [Betaproteobacteria bacterium]|nr:class II histone deacetylase [Betaproteobacteria bacterium]
MWHDTGNLFGPPALQRFIQPLPHPERPETKRRIKNLLDMAGLTPRLTEIEPRLAMENELQRFHTAEYVRQVREVSAGGGGQLARRFGATPIGQGGYEIALLAAGGAIALADAVLDGRVDNGYALVRPPGHHARPDEAMGFCVFGNVAIAGLHLLEARGLERIAIVDWDAHHGNGTQEAFWRDPRALTISIHQAGCYPPDSGPAEETGEGPGRGYNLNIPLPPGSGNGAYRACFERVVIPALRAYRPQFILVASGLDAGAQDPLARMMVTASGYRWMARELLATARDLCGGKVAAIHEGGYSESYVPFLCVAVIEELLGVRSDVEDPFAGLDGQPYQELQPHQADIIGVAERLLRTAPFFVRSS